VRPWYAADGAIGGIVIFAEDITEWKLVEEALRESELRFRIMISAIPNLSYETDGDGVNIFTSDQWRAYTGMTAEESAGAGFIRAYHPDEADDVLAQWRAAVRSGMSFERKCRIRAAGGSYRWFLNRAQPGRDAEGRIVRWAGSLTDIDDLVRAEEALRESKERLAGIVSSAMDAIITVDEDQRVVLFNEAAERMFGCRAAEALGQPFNRFIPERFRGAHTELVRRFGETGGASRAMRSLTALRADGTEFPIEAAISKVEVGGRKLYTLIHRDITERKQAEAEREQLALEQSARAAAEAANRSKDEFLAMVSHELRSPLNAILGYTRILRSGPVDQDAINNVTAIVERNAKAQLQIIEDLLDSARIITGKLRIERALVDLAPVLEAALDTVRSAAEAKGVTLVADFGALPEQVLGDSTRLQQVVWNLLTNAVKFTPEGGRVELRMEGALDNVQIMVSDTGKGIEPEFLPFVFDSFRQADSSSVRRFGGLGLGLSLVKNLVELHGGTITASSEGEGRGATFTVMLPRRQLEFIEPPTLAVAPLEARIEDSVAMDRELWLEGVSVLVVDDQEDAREMLIQALSEYGAQVTAVSSGAEALAYLSDPPGGKRPDALVLDIAMPNEDGYTALKRVRALEVEQGATADKIPAIALTAYGRSEDRLRALRAGFQMHVAKPVEPAELAVVIASLTTRRAWERERKG
jgi:PAS domain S-box-containing protein